MAALGFLSSASAPMSTIRSFAGGDVVWLRVNKPEPRPSVVLDHWNGQYLVALGSSGPPQRGSYLAIAPATVEGRAMTVQVLTHFSAWAQVLRLPELEACLAFERGTCPRAYLTAIGALMPDSQKALLKALELAAKPLRLDPILMLQGNKAQPARRWKPLAAGAQAGKRRR